MCSIMTIDRDFYVLNRRDVIATLQSEFQSNPDGFALCFQGEREEDDCIIRGMNITMLYNALDTVFQQAGRAFIHLRFATTHSVGVTTTHGFINANGQVIMHNGVINNPEGLLVDSYRLTEYYDGDEAFLALKLDKETYANCFFIDTLNREYTVFRLERNSLYHDGFGNYCTVPCAEIQKPMDKMSIENHGGVEDDDWEFRSTYLPARYRAKKLG